jgi:hypothetical protein
VYRGIVAYCTACGAPRPPLTGSALQLAGQPARVGGAVAKVFGWLALFFGATLALALGALAQAIVGGIAGLVVGGPIAVIALVIAVLLIRGGGRLGKQGTLAEREARKKAIFELAAHRGGTLTPLDVAQALELRAEEADRILTSLAHEESDRVVADVDPGGTLVYRFDVAVPANHAGRARIDPEVARSPNREEWERLEALEAERARARQPR